MSFRERIGHQQEWDPDEDTAPPVWHDQSASATSGGAPSTSTEDLPTWSRSDSGASRSDEDSYLPLPPPPPRRTSSATSDRRTTAWPSLRDSLKGSSAASSPGSRSGRSAGVYGARPTTPTSPTAYPSSESVDDELPWPLPEGTQFGYDEVPPAEQRYPVRRGTPARSRQRSRRAAPAQNRPSMQLPAALATVAAAQDRTVLAAIGGSVFSLFMMVATVSSRSDSLPAWIPIHLNAAGDVDRWGTASTVWRLPLMTAMLTLATFVGALFVSRRDPFAARFLLVSVLLIHMLAWIGLVRILW
jgi:hypothetical protein